MSFHHPRIAFRDAASPSSRQFSRLGLLEKAAVIARLDAPPARPRGSNQEQLSIYWHELERLGEIDRQWQSILFDTLREVDAGKRSLDDPGLSEILTPEVIARLRDRDFLAISAENQAIANRSAAVIIGLSRGMPKEAAEICSGRTGEVERILANPGRAVDRLVYEGFLAPDKAFEIQGALEARKETRQAA